MKREYRCYQALDRSYSIRCYFDCRWLKWTQGFTPWGRTIYFRLSVNQVTRALMTHEMTHVAQRRRLCIFGWWWSGSIAWLTSYAAMWLWSAICCLCHGVLRDFWHCVYENVWYERQAYRAMAACNEETKGKE